MLGPAGMVLAAGTAAASGSPTGPDGPPTNVSTYNEGDEEFPRTGVQWTNGDVLAITQVGFSTSPVVDPTSVWTNVAAGETNIDTGDNTAGRYWWARHNRGGQNTVWVFGGEGFGDQ